MADQDEDKDNKTEEPTERKLRKAREKGDVASSKEAGNVMAVLSLFAITAFVLPSVSAPLAGVFRNVLESSVCSPLRFLELTRSRSVGLVSVPKRRKSVS